ncbi:MAG: bifunctional folylpolyglutamate synthase/dihydrofolate synthase [Rhodospirillum sp.]|nr:bifunctional folylpolyglutamate synthase/dihydrofolate synthase [Rhodospirillum sp.]MCF8487535.1 bifunctional folylpolyglutamate synthase/dihydrofolate synthase [Rhodospirillum sp.]
MGPSDAVLTRMMALHPKVIDLSLGRVERLLATLGHPERTLPPVIHVAGTNGKGSTVAFLRAALEAAGLKVHAYTSPHLVRFNERIRLSGKLIPEDALTALLEEVEAANGDRPITYFEVTTAAALLAFSRAPANVLLLEVGLGGRLDATNVVESPAVTVITPVDLDHQGYLGSTLAAIAAEKAGIMKSGVTAVVAPQKQEALAILSAHADEIGAPLSLGGQSWQWTDTASGWRYGMTHNLPEPRLMGEHQKANAALAFATLDALETATGLTVDWKARTKALTTVDWPARLQHLTTGTLAGRLPGDFSLWLDGGHNPHAARALAATLATAAHGTAPLDLVCGMLDTKDALGFLKPLASLTRIFIAVPVASGQTGAGLPAHALADKAREAGFKEVRTATSVTRALEDLAGREGPARVLICGSLYLAGAALWENGTPPV